MLQSLGHHVEYPSWEHNFDMKESDDNMFKTIF